MANGNGSGLFGSKYFEDAVLIAYAEGVRDTLLAIQRGVIQAPKFDARAILERTHGLLAPESSP